MRAKVLGKSLFKKIWATLKHLPKYIPERLHWAVHYFLIILGNSLDNNLLNVNDKKKQLTKQCTPCSGASMMIFQERILAWKGSI